MGYEKEDYGFYCDPEEYHHQYDYTNVECLEYKPYAKVTLIEHKLNEKQQNFIIGLYIFTVIIIMIEFWLFT